MKGVVGVKGELNFAIYNIKIEIMYQYSVQKVMYVCMYVCAHVHAACMQIKEVWFKFRNISKKPPE